MYIIKILDGVYLDIIIYKYGNVIILILVHHSNNLVIMEGIQVFFKQNHGWGLYSQYHRNNWDFNHSLGLNSKNSW